MAIQRVARRSILANPDSIPKGAKQVDGICRVAWGASKPQGPFVRHSIRRVTVHHSASALTENSLSPSRFRAYQVAHLARGWPDIAYHVLIDGHGNIYRGRPLWARPDSATEYECRGHLAVLCDGDFDRQGPSSAQVRALVDVLAWACGRFDLSPEDIRGHRDYTTTECPGARLYELLADGSIRGRVRRRLRAGGVGLVELCGPRGRERVRLIEAGEDRSAPGRSGVRRPPADR